MQVKTQALSNARARRASLDLQRTGPGTLAGRYLRTFWQPVYHSAELESGRAKPIRIMGVDYTLFRGADGIPHLVDQRCPHRGTQLSAGWIEGSAIRCFYHGWMFDGTGQCLHQPAEPKSFAHKVKIGGYPCRDYVGLIFAYLGEGDPPEFPTYSVFDNVEGIIECDSYLRHCNYFSNLDNGADLSHSGFTHRNNPGSFDGLEESPTMSAKESCWGITVVARWSTRTAVSQIGMPNIFHHKAQPTDPEVAIFREFMAWWVPIDDESHIQFTVAAVRLPPDKARLYVERREQRLAKRTATSIDLADNILKGKLYVDQVDPASTDYVRLQDHVAQVGQGAMPDHANERLGQSDNGVILVRKVWRRELARLAKGEPLTTWTYDPVELSISRGEELEEFYRSQVAGTPAAELQPH